MREGLHRCALWTGSVILSLGVSAASAQEPDRPNILVIWGDDIGWSNISTYNHGMMG